MQRKKQKDRRLWEILGGGMLILVAFSFIGALLLDFRFVSPDATPQEDLAYLSESIPVQKTSSWAWLLTSILTFASVPLYLLAFRNHLRVLHILNSVFMLFAAAGFLMMARTGLKLESEMAGILSRGIDLTTEKVQLSLLEKFSQEQIYRRMGSSFVGLWAVVVSLSRIRAKRIPLATSVLLFISGPLLVYYNWYDPEHIVRTIAMAGIIIGIMILSVRMINRGLYEPNP
jgi:hypothetical protein